MEASRKPNVRLVKSTSQKQRPEAKSKEVSLRPYSEDQYRTASERRDNGKALREEVPREAHAGWKPPKDRRHPVDLLLETEKDRIPELLPIRGGRMGLSPFAFFRGSAALMASCSLLLVTLWMITMPVTAFAQTQTATSALTEEEKLEREFTDPLSSLPQLLVRDSYTPANYGPGPCTSQVCFRNAETNQLLIRPLIPRIPPESLLPFAQLIRPTFQLVTVQSSRGGTRTEFGDLPVFDIAVLPWPDRQKTGLLIGAGAAFVFPTATSRSAGQGAWQAGPALGAIYTGIPGLLIGFVALNPVSFAYTSPNRLPQNTFQFQPVFALHLWEKWYLRSAEANWMMGWRRHYPTMLPLSIGLGRTIVRPGLPPMSIFVTGQWMAYRQFAPIAPQTTINFGLTVAFPQFRDYFSE